MMPMKGIAVLFCLLPAAADMLPLSADLCLAVGQEPYLTLAELGAPLPPTPEEVGSLPPRLFVQQQRAVKEALLLRWVLIRASQHRASALAEEQSAGLARAAEAPELLSCILQRFADGRMSRSESYAWELSLESLLQSYKVDMLAIRLLAEVLDIPADQAMEKVAELAAFLPLEDAFNTLPLRMPTDQQLEADLLEMERCYAAIAQVYARVHDAESAELAAQEALPLVRCLLTTQPSLCRLRDPATQLTAQPHAALLRANSAHADLQQQRRRLQESRFCGSLKLLALDALAE